MILAHIPAGSKPPALHWWGNAFYRCWGTDDGLGWQQLVIVVRLPWWRLVVHEDVCIPREEGMPYFMQTWMQREQLIVSWRVREGWRSGWRKA